MSIALNNAPFFNDYDEFKNYHQILFKPGFAVQARELTELQSILKNQIEKFGNHIFKQGSVVIPGNSNGDIGVSYVTIETDHFDLLYVGQVLVSPITNIKAIIKKIVPATTNDNITLYINYITGGNVAGNITFSSNERLIASDSLTFECNILTSGIGSLAYINTGVYYVNGTFVTVPAQSVIMDKYGISPHCHVLLKINEHVVSSEEDTTLLDTAYGSYNFSAPGADRLQITLELVTLPYDSSIDNSYIELMRYKNGMLEEHSRYPKYNELEKSLARRTADESGDYVVNGLRGKIKEHLRESNNGGVSLTGNRDNYVVEVSPGKTYINGYEIEKLSPTQLIQSKARTIDHIKSKNVGFRVEYGRYILATDIKGALSIKEKQKIDFYTGITTTPGQKIGSARILAIDYFDDAQAAIPIYKIWITDIETTSTLISLENVGIFLGEHDVSGSIVHELTVPLTAGNFVVGEVVSYNTDVRSAIVCHWTYQTSRLYVKKVALGKSLPVIGDLIVGSQANGIITNKAIYFGTSNNIAILQLPIDHAASLETQYNSNVYNFNYHVHAEFTIYTDAVGNGISNSTTGTIRSIDTGAFSVISSSGIIVPLSLFSISFDNKTIVINSGPRNEIIKIFAVVEKSTGNSGIKTKTLTEITETEKTFDESGYIQLNNSDVYSIVNVTTTSGSVIPVANIVLHTNQTDYAYMKSGISIINTNIPAESISITYKYFVHGNGDFFCVDSYKNNDEFETLAIAYKSSNGNVYNLKQCIDFRSTANSNNNFDVGANVSDPFVTGEIFNTDIQYWVPRYDLLVIDKNSSLHLIQGVPSDTPAIPNTPADCLALEYYYIPAYTEKISDIEQVRMAVDRFTMQEISTLASRVDSLEDFSTLLAAEVNAIQYEIIDEESGLARFKTGYLVETFKTPLVIADVFDEQFHATFYDGSLKPAVEEMHCVLDVIRDDAVYKSFDFQNSNGLITLPYTETTLISQRMSSRVTNLNPFLVIRWNGILNITPNSDYWIEQLDLPSIVEAQTEIVTVTRWSEFPNGPTVHEDIRTGTTVMPVTTAPFIRTIFV